MAIAIIFAALILLFVPITAGAETMFDGKKKKIYFTLCLYRFLKIVRGEVLFSSKNLTLKIGKKQKVIPYGKLLQGNMSLDVFYGFSLDEATAILEIGKKDDKLMPLAVGGAFTTLGSIFASIVKTFTPATKTSFATEIHENESVFLIHANIAFTFNIFIVILAITKLIAGKIINGKRKSKQN